MKSSLALEKIAKGFANRRRVEILKILHESPKLSVVELAEVLKSNLKTLSQHTYKMEIAGLLEKRNDGNFVRHELTARGRKVLEFLRIIE